MVGLLVAFVMVAVGLAVFLFLQMAQKAAMEKELAAALAAEARARTQAEAALKGEAQGASMAEVSEQEEPSSEAGKNEMENLRAQLEKTFAEMEEFKKERDRLSKALGMEARYNLDLRRTVTELEEKLAAFQDEN